jgi:hypothetical protein
MSSLNALSGAGSPQGRLRWKRFAIIAVPCAIVAVILIGLTAQGAIGASISVSGQAYEVTANQLKGTGFEQFGSTVKDARGNQHPVAVSGIRSATLSNLCQAVTVGGISLILRAGSGNKPVSASNLIVDADQQSGNATFHNIAIGQDASTLNAVPGTAGSPGGFGEQASGITINGLRQHTWLTTAGTFTLPGLHVSVSRGGSC